MNAISVVMATLALGVDYGWQPVSGGGIEYIIQLEPAALDALGEGQDLVSDLPPYLRNVRSYRITVGTAPLPHEGEPPPEEPKKTEPLQTPRMSPPGIGSGPITSSTSLAPPTSSPSLSLTPPSFTTPNSFDPVPSQPLVTPATATQVETPAAKTESKKPTEDTARVLNIETPKPWKSFSAALVALFISLGVNAYQGWLNIDLRQKYRSALAGWKR